MKPLLSYLLQVILASGLLYGYYHFVLRNSRFHRYNRYYLLFLPLLSVLVPFLNIPVYFSPNGANPASSLFYSLVGSDRTSLLTQGKEPGINAAFSLWSAVALLYSLVAAFILVRVLLSLFSVWKLRRSNPAEKIEDLWFIPTNAKGTPFSFFRWLFWNRSLPLDSSGGEQVFRHEVYHIRNRHSLDIILMEITCVLFWINPFFHLARKELRAIHEFLADRFAATPNREWDYAELLLMQALQTNNPLVTPFFQSQIKRRIAMITSSKQPRYQYLRKLLVLPLLAVVMFLFAFSYHQRSGSSTAGNLVLQQPTDTPRVKQPSVITLDADTIRLKIANDQSMKATRDTFVVNGRKLSQEEMVGKYGKTIRVTGGKVQVTEKPAEDGDGNRHIVELRNVKVESGEPTVVLGYARKREEPMFIIDGKSYIGEAGKRAMEQLSPNEIAQVSVFKDQSAVEKYGPDAAGGVVEITTKLALKKEIQEVTVLGYKVQNRQKQAASDTITVVGYGTRKSSLLLQKQKQDMADGKEVIVEGKQIPKSFEQLNAIYPNPATNEATISLNAREAGEGNLLVYDVSGQVVANRKVTLAKGSNTLPVDVSNLKPGTYMISVRNGNEPATNVFKLIKN